MKKKIFRVAALFVIIATVFFAAALFFAKTNDHHSQDAGEYAVLLNEVTVLAGQMQTNPADQEIVARFHAAIAEMENYETAPNAATQNLTLLASVYFFCILFAAFVFLYCYLRIIKPFAELERFAKEVAKGNLDLPLEIQKENIFGAFSWAFDLMRSELKVLRESEALAKHENKALIAAISHDIKTPVASIRAYAEALANDMDNTKKRRERYLTVIMKKADEVTKLTNDLFLHALSDIEKLQFEIKPYPAKSLLAEILDPFFAEYEDQLKLTAEIPDCCISTDEKRLAQVFENIFANAVKYAPASGIEISFTVDTAENNALFCEIRDFGSGIPAHDVPFIWNRFYRGENTKNISGSGLGLYIVKYIIEKCGGFVRLANSGNGLAVIFSLPLFF